MSTSVSGDPHADGAGPLTVPDTERTERRTASTQRASKALGWFSTALGGVEIVAPGRFSRLIGVADGAATRRVVRLMGIRELAVVPGLFDRPRPGGFLAARVGGDLLDLGLLVVAMRARRTRRRRVSGAAVAVAGITLLDLVTALAANRTGDASTEGAAIRARSSITVNRSADDVYALWRDLEQLPSFMAHLRSVRDLGGGRSRWAAAAPGGRTVEWDAEIAEDRPAELIAWRSSPEADVPNRGSVRFTAAPGDRGTEVRVDLEYEPPAGAVGAAVARLFGEDPTQQVGDDLRRFKQLLEAGTIVRSDGVPDGLRSQRQLHQGDAQPAG